MNTAPFGNVTISIATKDRADVLDNTLRKLHAFGLSVCPVILWDDGSNEPLNPAAKTLFPNARLFRNEFPRGQAITRNQIAMECKTPYILQLDDDSYPVEGDLGALLRFAEKQMDCLAIALPFTEPARGRDFPENLPSQHGLRLRSFVGCAALLNTDIFLSIGGYADWINRTAEEDELCTRALSAGKSVFIVDILRIQHDVTPIQRSVAGISLRNFQNWLLLWCVHAPSQELPRKAFRLFAGCLKACIILRSSAPLKGFLQGLMRIPSIWKLRNPLSSQNYKLYQALPHALDFTSKQMR